MRGARKVLRIFGIDVLIHYSWWFVFVFLTISLGISFFPNLCAGELSEGLFASQPIPDCANLSNLSYWLMGAVASLFLFISVLLHELSHSLVAKLRKIKVDNITLFFFGGVAGIESEDLKPSSEFLMAIAGPLFSIFLGFIFLLINRIYVNGIITAITSYLYLVNFVLAGFNLVPGYPLDGGRAFRAVLHYYFKDLKKATKIASMGGRFFAIFLIVWGILTFLQGGWWMVFLGGFLYFIAGVSYEQVVVKETLSKVPVKEILTKRYKSINPEMKFHDFLKKNSSFEDEIFIVKNKNFLGIFDFRKLNKMSKQMQRTVKIKQISIPLSKVKSLDKNDNAYTAFKEFAKQKTNLLPVMERNKLLGFVTRRAVMNRLVISLKYGVGSVNDNGSKKKKIKPNKKV